jgi:glutamine amidotransferase
VSEPLNDDDDAWVEIPDGTAVVIGENGFDMRIFQLDQEIEAKRALRQP